MISFFRKILSGRKKIKLNTRAKAPTLLQMEAVECGAAALGIILGYYRRFVALEELRVACSVSRDGTSAQNVILAGRKYGLKGKGFKKEPHQLREIPLPAILFWNFNHFVVLEGFKGKRVFINDPDSGPRETTEDELDESFTGVVLTFEPEKYFEEGGEAPSVIKSLKRRFTGSKRELIFIILAGLALVPPGLAIPIFSQIFVDKYLVSGLKNWLFPLLIGMGITAILRAGLTYLQQYYLLRLQMKLSVLLSSKFFWHVLRLPYDFYTQRFSGEIGTRVSLNNEVASMLSGRLASAFIQIVLAVFYGALLVTYDLTMTLIGVASIVLNILILKAVARRRLDSTRKLQQDQGKLMGTFIGGLSQIESLKATGGETDFFQRIAGFQAKIVKTSQTLAQKTLYLSLAPTLIDAIVNALVLTIGVWRVMQGDMTMGMLVAFQSLMASFIGPINSLVGLGGELQILQASLNRLDDVLRHPVDTRFQREVADPEEQEVRRLKGHIELRSITYGYSPLHEPLISDFSCTIKPGARIALVGGSGSGKSTLARVICGLFSPWEGEVLLDGKPVSGIPRNIVSSSMAFIDQEIVLLEGSIRNNVTMWDHTIPEADVIKACSDAGIHDEIVARPGGYESDVGENGQNFSGGQRQRLDIARALVTNPSILILDEATSALDPLSEQHIDRCLRRRGCTCIMIAHRLSTIRDCDEIIVLQNGKVVQRGTHEELVKETENFYHRIVSATT